MYDRNPMYQVYKNAPYGDTPAGERAERVRSIRKHRADGYAEDRRRRRSRRGTSYARPATVMVPTVSVYPSDSFSLLQRTVDRVNQLRHQLGMDPIPDLVPGQSGDSNYCPVTRTMRVGQNPLEFMVSTSERQITVWLGPDEDGISRRMMMELPKRGQATFPDRFDAGDYEEYDLVNTEYLGFRTDAY